MSEKIPNIYFFIPSEKIVSNFNINITSYWNWINHFIEHTPIDLLDGSGKCGSIGPYNWTIQTYIYLKHFKYKYQITNSLDVEGIIISHSDFLPRYIKPSPKRFIVEIKPDRSLKSIFANFAIVQNSHDPISNGFRKFFISSAYINYWPQPSMIKRDISRGSRIKNVCYVGKIEQFISNVSSLKKELRKLGMRFKMIPRKDWNNYSEIDVIVAVRKNAKTRKKLVASNLSSSKKPASKLINSWMAGVPAILSRDDAFLELKKTERDFLEADDLDEIINQLKRLKNDPKLFHSMIKNGFERSEDFYPEIIAKQWHNLIHKSIVPNYFLWRNSFYRRFFMIFCRGIFYPKILKLVFKDFIRSS